MNKNYLYVIIFILLITNVITLAYYSKFPYNLKTSTPVRIDTIQNNNTPINTHNQPITNSPISDEGIIGLKNGIYTNKTLHFQVDFKDKYTIQYWGDPKDGFQETEFYITPKKNLNISILDVEDGAIENDSFKNTIEYNRDYELSSTAQGWTDYSPYVANTENIKVLDNDETMKYTIKFKKLHPDIYMVYVSNDSSYYIRFMYTADNKTAAEDLLKRMIKTT